MQRFKLFLTSASLFALPLAFTHAQVFNSGSVGSDLGGVSDFMSMLSGITTTIIIPFLLLLGFLVFVWGMFKYFIVGAADEEARSAGKSLIIYSVLAFVLILSFWGLINFFTESLGLNDAFDDTLIPTMPEI